ncbi:MAG: prepilin peptidase, partial [Desulfuromonadales bacterium]|nr:prepilin peptidase [Desulfuromonadales bacterium]
AYSHSLAIVSASLFFLCACATDTFKTRIPNQLILVMLVTGISYNICVAGWQGLLFGVKGFLLGFALLLLPFVMGGFGAGDLKAVSALGSLIGPSDLLQVFIYMACYGGILAVVHQLYQHMSTTERSILCESKSVRFPYAAAIALGYSTFVIRGGII